MARFEHPKRPKPAMVIVGMMVSIGLAGCTAGSSAVDVSPEVTSALPLLTNLPPELYVAHNIAAGECMSAAGFAVPFDASVASASRNTSLGFVGVFASEESARTVGYDTTFVLEGLTSRDSFRDSLPEQKKALFDASLEGSGAQTETLVLENGMEFGKASDGCLATADVAVFGSVLDAMKLELFTNDVTSQARNVSGDMEAAVGGIIPDYEKCMSDSGFEVTGLNAATFAEDEFGHYKETGGGPSAAEQKLAVTDFECQQSVGLDAVISDVFVKEASAWLAGHEDEILALKESLDASLERAKTIVNGN